MATSNSRVKLREAAYFLTGMCQRNGTERLDMAEEFGYFLSAFLSAARSVSFVLHKENSDTYPAIRDEWLASLDPVSAQLCRDMVEHRNTALKQGELPTYDVTSFVSWPAHIGSRGSSRQLIQPWMYDSGAQIGVAHFKLDTPTGPQDAVAVCQRYWEHLERLLTLFEGI
jgi:hypothetical protein